MSEALPISPAYPFESRYVEVRGSRLHYVEEGQGEPILFLHGNPTWSYLWRNIIPHLRPQGRCIAVDLIGMGKSDKPVIEYRFRDHYEYLEGFIQALGLKDLTLVLHDWGSALGFRYAMRHEDDVKALAFMEAIIAPLASWSQAPKPMRSIFKAFRTPIVGRVMIMGFNMFVERILPGAIVRKLSQEELQQYRSPYPGWKSREPLWRWPNEIPAEGKPRDVVEAVEEYNRWLRASQLPKLLFACRPGAIMPARTVEWCRRNLSNLTVIELGKGIHYVQEDHPHRIGQELAQWRRQL